MDEVVAATEILYNADNADSRKSAEDWLLKFQEAPEAVQVAADILSVRQVKESNPLACSSAFLCSTNIL